MKIGGKQIAELERIGGGRKISGDRACESEKAATLNTEEEEGVRRRFECPAKRGKNL